MLHVPWQDESLMLHGCTSYEECYHTLKEGYPSLRGSVERELHRKQMTKETDKKVEEILKKKEQKKNDKEDTNDGSNTDAAPVTNYDDESTDLLDSLRKNTSIKTEDELKNYVDNMSDDQLRLYEDMRMNMEHVSRHRKKQCTCDQLRPLKMFMFGGPGAGKSYVITALMGWAYVQTVVMKNPVGILLAAPTGIAADSVGGVTLHKLWKLPVSSSTSRNKVYIPYTNLSDDDRCRMKAEFANVCGFIMDEVSMVTNAMLMHIHLRLQEVFDSDKVFGGISILSSGDFLQLGPPFGDPSFETLTPRQVQIVSGNSGVPTSVDLWGTFAFHKLNNNHRCAGVENEIWRGIIERASLGNLNNNDVEILSKRLINTVDCTTKEEKLDVVTSNFIKAVVNKEDPLCLNPKRSMCAEFNNAVMIKRDEKPVKIGSMEAYYCPKAKKKKVII